MNTTLTALKTDITADRNFPVLLDISRLISRVGHGRVTGIDRVERAYMRWCLASDFPVFGLVRTASGFSVLDRRALEQIEARVHGTAVWGPRDLRARVGIKTPVLRGRAESDIRRMAVASGHLGHVLAKIPLIGSVYINSGHSNLSEQTLKMIAKKGLKRVIFVHDMIPLDYPQYQRDNTPAMFKARMKLVAGYHDLVIANSATTQDRVGHYFELWDQELHSIKALLGVSHPVEIHKNPHVRPYFVTLGTIEPRKNHKLLLDIWDQFGPEAPDLHIVGRRGWRNADIFARLDQPNVCVHEHGDLSDDDLWSLLAGAHGLLFPSFAEGFGLPSLEAATMGVPVICGDLPIHYELLDNYPIYANLADTDLWKSNILKLAASPAQKQPVPDLPDWNSHFKRVNTAICNLV